MESSPKKSTKSKVTTPFDNSAYRAQGDTDCGSVSPLLFVAGAVRLRDSGRE